MSYRDNKLFVLSRNGKTIRKLGHVTLTFDLTFSKSIVFVRWSTNMFELNFIKLSAAVHELLIVHWISDNSRRLRSRLSLERMKQSTAENGVINCDFFPRSAKTIWWTLVVHLRKKMTYDPEMQYGLCGCQDAYMFIAHFIKLSAAVNKLSSVQEKNSDEDITVRRYRADSENRVKDNHQFLP